MEPEAQRVKITYFKGSSYCINRKLINYSLVKKHTIDKKFTIDVWDFET